MKGLWYSKYREWIREVERPGSLARMDFNGWICAFLGCVRLSKHYRMPQEYCRRCGHRTGYAFSSSGIPSWNADFDPGLIHSEKKRKVKMVRDIGWAAFAGLILGIVGGYLNGWHAAILWPVSWAVFVGISIPLGRYISTTRFNRRPRCTVCSAPIYNPNPAATTCSHVCTRARNHRCSREEQEAADMIDSSARQRDARIKYLAMRYLEQVTDPKAVHLLSIEAGVENGVTILKLAGRLDAASAPLLEREFATCLGKGARNFVWDFSGLKYIGTEGIQAIGHALELLSSSGGQLALACKAPLITEYLKSASFASRVGIFADRRGAVESLLYEMA